MTRAIATLILLSAGLASAGFCDEKCHGAEGIPLCSVLADPSKYDGKDVVVLGTYYRVIHGSILTASACEKTKVNMRLASDWKGEKRYLNVLNTLTRKNQSTEVILRGTFRVAQGECFGQTCSLYEIEAHELVCAWVGQPSSAKNQR